MIKNAIKKYGKENFRFEILYFLDSKEAMYAKEAELVNEDFLKRDDVYNIKLGGYGGWDHTKGTVTVRDKDGNTLRVSVNDKRYLSGELIACSTNKVTVQDKDGKYYQVDKNDPEYLSGEFVHLAKGRKTSDKTKKLLSDLNKNKIRVKNKDGKIFVVSSDDTRFLSGELTGITKGCQYSNTHKQRISEAHKNKIWIHNSALKPRKFLKKLAAEPYLNSGWQLGFKFTGVVPDGRL